MAINDTNERDSTARFGVGGAEVPKESPQTMGKKWDWGAKSQSGPISPFMGSEQLEPLKKSLQKVIDTARETNPNSPVQVTLNTIDNAAEGVYYSSIIMQMKIANGKNVAAFALLLQSSKEDPAPVVENINGQQREVQVFPADAYDDKFIQAFMLPTVMNAYPQTHVHAVGGLVVPRGFNPEDSSKVQALAATAGQAMYTYLLSTSEDFVDIDVTNLSKEPTIAVDMAFEDRNYMDCIGMPIRSDFTITMSSRPVQEKRNVSLNGQKPSEKFSFLSGYMDIDWAPYNSVVDPWANMMVPQQPIVTLEQKYAAKCVITSIETPKLATLPAIMFALATATSVSEANSWFHAFYQRKIGGEDIKGIDFSDIGALNLEAKLGGQAARVDTKSNDFNDEAFVTLMKNLFRPGVTIALDVPWLGPQSWALNVFREAAAGNPAARRAIVNAVDVLTAGKFTSLLAQYPGADSFFVDAGDTVHMGYYPGREGNVHDIRKVDYLAVTNVFGEKDPSIIARYSNTFNDSSRLELDRLLERKEIIDSILGNKAVYTGYATRLVFLNSTMQCLTHALQAAGINTRLSTPNTTFGTGHGRTSATYVNSSMLPVGHMGMYTMGMPFGANQPTRHVGPRPMYSNF